MVPGSSTGISRLGDKVQWEGWKFEIVDMDGETIDKVLAQRSAAGEDASAAEA